MKRSLFLLLGALMLVFAPVLACGPAAISKVTPTPTKTPKRVLALEQIPTATQTPTPTVTPLPTDTPVPPTDTPVPPTDTPVPPTDTPVPPTNTPIPPPPPPTDTPIPAPTQPPAPVPTQPPANPLEVIIEFPNGQKFGANDNVRINFIVRDPNGVSKFEWGIFTQNQTSLKGGKKECGGATECRQEVKEKAPPIAGTFIVGADAISSNGATKRGLGEIYVSK